MRKLALSDEILMKVDKPARYIGNVLVPITRSQLQISLIYFISERERHSMAISLSFIRRQRLMVFQGKSFYMRLQRLRAFMYLLCMRWSTMRMEQSAV